MATHAAGFVICRLRPICARAGMPAIPVRVLEPANSAIAACNSSAISRDDRGQIAYASVLR